MRGPFELRLDRRGFGMRFGQAATGFAAGWAGWRMSQAWAARAAEYGKPRKACILVWLAGAPSQLEMWDPKPGTANGGPTKAIATAVPAASAAEVESMLDVVPKVS